MFDMQQWSTGKGELLSNSPEPNDYPYGKLKIDAPSQYSGNRFKVNKRTIRMSFLKILEE